MKVLIAEDDPVSALALQTLLTRQGYDVTHAHDGAEAWNLLQKETFPLMILDWMMPHMDGLEVCRRVRSSLGGPYRCVVMLTAKQEAKDRSAAMNAGVDVFLSKPLNAEEMVARLKMAERILEIEN
jgi:two-component system cell cycle response regulator